MPLGAQRVLPGAQAKALRETQRQREADGHAFAMHETGAVVVDEALEGVAEGVAEVEQRAVALLGLVARDDGGLALAAHRDGADLLGLAVKYRVAVGFQPFEETAVADQTIFDDLGVTGAKLARRQRRQRVDVGEHQRRLVKGADQDSCLAAN